VATEAEVGLAVADPLVVGAAVAALEGAVVAVLDEAVGALVAGADVGLLVALGAVVALGALVGALVALEALVGALVGAEAASVQEEDHLTLLFLDAV
jgi:hypothetical protein